MSHLEVGSFFLKNARVKSAFHVESVITTVSFDDSSQPRFEVSRMYHLFSG